MTLYPGLPFVMKATARLPTPVEAGLGVLQVLELINKDVAADITSDGAQVHLGDMPPEEPGTSESRGSTKITHNLPTPNRATVGVCSIISVLNFLIFSIMNIF